jgi:magnesium-transporting ATPase (P-type)
MFFKVYKSCIPIQERWIHLLEVAPIGTMFGRNRSSPGIMNRKPRKINELIIDVKRYARLFLQVVFNCNLNLLFPILQVR